MTRTESFEKVQIRSSGELRRWLESHHGRQDSVWLVTFKKHVGEGYVSRDEVLDELLCFGWIDGIRRKLDEDRTMQLISPRRAQHWARSYKERARRLEAEGRMRPPGRDAIASSKEAGLWDFMDDVDALVKPADLEEALAEYPKATRHFDAFPDSSKRNALRWVKLAKTEATRRKRIRKLAELASRNERLPLS